MRTRHTDTSPWQVRAIATIGVPSVIALGLVWWVTQTVSPNIDAIKAMVVQHVSDQAVIRTQNEKMLKVLSGTCLNQAQTNEERERCIQ